MDVKHQTFVVKGPPSGSEGGRMWLLFLLAAICVLEGSGPLGGVPNRGRFMESHRKTDMWFGDSHP